MHHKILMTELKEIYRKTLKEFESLGCVACALIFNKTSEMSCRKHLLNKKSAETKWKTLNDISLT